MNTVKLQEGRRCPGEKIQTDKNMRLHLIKLLTLKAAPKVIRYSIKVLQSTGHS